MDIYVFPIDSIELVIIYITIVVIQDKSKEKVIGHSMYEFKSEFSEEVINISSFYDRMLLKEGKSLSHELKVRCVIDGTVQYFTNWIEKSFRIG